MQNQQKYQLAHMLWENEFITAMELAQALHVSDKTVRNLIKTMNQEMADRGVWIESRNRKGFRLIREHTDGSRWFSETYLTPPEKNAIPEIPDTSDQRIQYLITWFLNHRDYIKLEELEGQLFVSRKTLTSDLREAERFLNRYGMELERKPNYGIRSTGSEFSVRLCIAACIGSSWGSDRNPGLMEEDAGEERSRIAEIVLSAIRNVDFMISEISFENLLIHIEVAVRRIREGHCLLLDRNGIEGMISKKELDIAEEIARKTEEELEIRLSEDEMLYIALHLAGKRMYGPESDSSGNLVIRQQIIDLVDSMLVCVDDAFHYSMAQDFDLKLSLCQHMLPLRIRLRYHITLKNPLLKDIRERFPLAYTMAQQAATVCQEYYQCPLDEQEIGYIALAFALALERQNTDIRKKNILVVCASGKGSSQLLKYKYLEAFGKYIDSVQICDALNLEKQDFSGIDYVFTTVPIRISVPVPVMEVKYFLENQEITEIRKRLTPELSGQVTGYYSFQLFLPHIKARTKDEVLKILCAHIKKQNHVPERFYQAVKKREQLADTAMGNLVAMPHPYEALTDTTFVCVGILDEAVLWGEKKVQVIFLLSIENRKNKNLQKFYRVTSRFLMDEEYVKELIKKRDYTILAHRLEEIERSLEEQ